jgi:hypothetical protein
MALPAKLPDRWADVNTMLVSTFPLVHALVGGHNIRSQKCSVWFGHSGTSALD